MHHTSRLGIASMRAFVVLAGLTFSGQASAAEPGQIFTFFEAEQFEYRLNDDGGSFNWDVQGWIGDDDNKAWLKSEGEKPIGDLLEEAEVQLLYSYRISDFFDAQIGGRVDLKPEPERGFLVLALQGLAPYWIEVETSAFVSHKGEVSARFEAEADIFITQSLVLQPVAEVNVAVQEVEERGIGSGINDLELGLRLRYEIVREFAPYIGVTWERKFGQTADFARDEGEDPGAVSFVTGVRFWF